MQRQAKGRQVIGKNGFKNRIDVLHDTQSISEVKLSDNGSDTRRNERPRTDHELVSTFKQWCKGVGFGAKVR